MPNWRTDFLGGLGNGVSAPARLPGSNTWWPSAYFYDNYTGVSLASPGSVDTNTSTRYQYPLIDNSGNKGPLPTVQTNMTFTSADESGRPVNSYMTVVVYYAPASAFGAGVTPTPAQIRTVANGLGTRIRPLGAFNFGLQSWRQSAGDSSAFFSLSFLNADNFINAANTKFWIAAIPVYLDTVSGSPTSGIDTPIGDPNVNGRAVSLWYNRTSAAPKIKTPTGRISVRAGSTVPVSFLPQDPDRIASFPGDIGIADLDDVAGVQIQYAPVPTAANPDPVWSDLPVVKADGSGTTPGWWIHMSTEGAGNTGVQDFMLKYNLTIKCATVGALTPKTGVLPSGDWQLRVRTFDWGQPYANSSGATVGYVWPPLGNTWAGPRTPDAYPATNTSPWSAPFYISVSEQSPVPIPLSPINNIAVFDNAPVKLVWQYRNTYDPPFPQSGRALRIRKVGDPDWIDLTPGLPVITSSTTFTIPSSMLDFVSGNQYEWQVRTTDSSGSTSDWSKVARFWAVPIPNSGSVIPTPGDTIDGATLGCGTHRVEIYRRGGTERVGEIRNPNKVEWNRLRDDMSDATIEVTDFSPDCGEMLRDLQSWAYEIVLFRDNGFSKERVWEGPITLLTYEKGKVTINAKDVVAYLYRRIIKQAFNDTGNSPTAGRKVTERAAAIIQNAMAPDDPNVLQYLTVLLRDDDAKQYRALPEYSRTAYEEVDDMASNAGLDYTAVGRSIIVWGTKHRIGTLPEFTDANLGASSIVSEYGMSMANRYAVSDGNGVWGEADRLDENGEDPTYGLVEVLSSTWASDSDEESGTYTEAGLEKVRASFAQSAERSISDKYPPPVVVRVPDNTRLQPDTPITIQHLVPGVVIPLRSDSTLRRVIASQKLDSVKVVETAGEETITVTMSPFSRDDNTLETT